MFRSRLSEWRKFPRRGCPSSDPFHGELKSLQFAAQGRIDHAAADLHDEAADQRRIDLEVELNLAADAGTQGFEQRGLLGIGERAGRGHLGGEDRKSTRLNSSHSCE